jgi:prevent-host-death family protein
MEVNIHKAKTQLSRLLEKVLAGEEVVIAKAGRPIARLTRIEQEKPVLGSACGQITFHPGWDEPLSDGEIEEIFGG